MTSVLPEKEFVTCTACDDYDLCKECHIRNKHGHHPGHAFKAATKETILPPIADFLCNAGRNVRHSAVCDGCEKVG
jgi:next-to-BRCA1 protein 1